MEFRTTGHWMATGKAWGLASNLWKALLAWGAGGGPMEATAPTASTATYELTSTAVPKETAVHLHAQ